MNPPGISFSMERGFLDCLIFPWSSKGWSSEDKKQSYVFFFFSRLAFITSTSHRPLCYRGLWCSTNDR